MTDNGGSEKRHRRVAVFVAPEYHEPSQYAVTWAQENVFRAGDIVVLVTVVPTTISEKLIPAIGVFGSPSIAYELDAIEQLHKDRIEAAQQKLNEYKELLQTPGLNIKILTCVLEQKGGSVAETIVGWATKFDADETVVGSRDLSRFERVLIGLAGKGGVSTYLAENMPCPIVVVKHT